MMEPMDIAVYTTVVVTVWMAILATNRQGAVTWDVLRDIRTKIAAKVSYLFFKNDHKLS